MKEKELQIGDWVYIFDPDYKDEKEAYKVSEIREDGIRVYMFNDTYEENWFEPILLTPEIIEANNLCLGRNVFKHNVGPFEDDTIIDISRNLIMIDDAEKKEFWCLHLCNKECDCFEGGVISMNLNLLYVHQFQHALRVVGLTELADEFIIG